MPTACGCINSTRQPLPAAQHTQRNRGRIANTSRSDASDTAHLIGFVGTQKEIVEVWQLGAANCLTTPTGASGSGKSYSTLEVTRKLLDAFPDDAWFIKHAPLSDPALVPQTIVSTLA